MNTVTIVSAIVSAVGGIIGMLIYAIRLSSDYSKLVSTVTHIQNRVAEDRAKNTAKFDDLYAQKNEMRETLAKLQSSIDSLSRIFEAQLTSLERQLAEFSDQVRGLNQTVSELKHTRQKR